MYKIKNFLRLSLVSLSFLILSTLICGIFYPFIVTLSSFHQDIWVDKKDLKMGSFLLGQEVKDPQYFWGRLTQSVPSPFAPHHPNLLARIEERRKGILTYEKDQNKIVPLDLLTFSKSGIDPHISPEAAFFQVDRIAEIRHLPREKLNVLIESLIETKTLGFLGERRVNVLRLNLALDQVL